MSSSGEEWRKTECGWKLLPSIHPEVLGEVGRSSSSSSRTVCTKINEPADGTTLSILECWWVLITPWLILTCELCYFTCSPASEENEKISKQQKELNMMLRKLNIDLIKLANLLNLQINGVCLQCRLQKRFEIICLTKCFTFIQSSHYSTISDAVNKLNFEQALDNDGCFPFICQVLFVNVFILQ